MSDISKVFEIDDILVF